MSKVATPQIAGAIARPTIGFFDRSLAELKVMEAKNAETIAQYRKLAGQGGGSKEAAALEYFLELADELDHEITRRHAGTSAN